MSPMTVHAESKTAAHTVSLSEPQRRKGSPPCEKGLQKYAVVLLAVLMSGQVTSARLYHSYSMTMVVRVISGGSAVLDGVMDGVTEIDDEKDGVIEEEKDGDAEGEGCGVFAESFGTAA